MRYIILALMLLCTSVANAEIIKISDIITEIPEIKTGVAYSVPDGKFQQMQTFEVIEKYGASLDAGIVGNDIMAVALSYRLGNLEQFVNVPILKYVDMNVNVYYGLERINQFKSGEDWGIGISILKLRF